MLAGQSMKWTVREHDGGALDSRFVAVPGQHRGDYLERALVASAIRIGPSAEPVPGLARREPHRFQDVPAVAGRVLHSVGKNLSGQVVAPRRDRDRDLPSGAAVELRRATRARATAARQTSELGVEKALFDELVQVKLCGMPGQVSALRGLIPAHRLRLRDDIQVQRAPRRLGKNADASDLRDKVIQPCTTF